MYEYKKCKQCKQIKHFKEFYIQNCRFHLKDDLSARCILCEKTDRMITSAKSRAKLKGWEFNLTKEDIVIPEICPVLGITLKYNKKKIQDDSPTIDRIDNDKGYIKGNIIIVSARANRLKSNASLEELILIAEFYKKYQKKGNKVLDFLAKHGIPKFISY